MSFLGRKKRHTRQNEQHMQSKKGRKQGLGLEQEESFGIEHLAGKRGCMGFMERSLDLICRQWEATESFKMGCEVMYWKLPLWDTVSDWRKQR